MPSYQLFQILNKRVKYGVQVVLFDMAMFAYCNKLNRFQFGTKLGVKVAKQKVEDTCNKMCEHACIITYYRVVWHSQNTDRLKHEEEFTYQACVSSYETLEG